MARPTKISNEQILEAARSVFTECGLSATTAEIAKRAGCSEGSIFRRFPTKHELFFEAMGISTLDAFVSDVEPAFDQGTLEENFTLVAERLIAFYTELLPRMFVMLGCGFSPPDVMKSMPEPPPVRAIRFVTRFIEGERRRGRIRACDPEVVARSLIGACHFYSFAEVTGLNDMLPMPRQTFVRGLVDNTMRGIQC